MKKYILLITALMLLACDSNSDSNDSTSESLDIGQGGSLARFTIYDNYLYTVDDEGLSVFNITNHEAPVKVNEVPIGF